MLDITNETYKRNGIDVIRVHKRRNNISVLWIKMHNIQDKLGAKNMSDSVRTEIMSIVNTTSP